MLTFALALIASTPGPEVFVSPTGNDRAPGTLARPLKTIAKAVAKVRGKGGLVTLRGGRYELAPGIELGPKDSGLLLRAYRDEKPVLTGSVLISGTNFKPLKDPAVAERIIDPLARTRVKVADLSFVKGEDRTFSRGFGQPVRPAPMELFVDGRPWTLARWPNDGFAQTGKVLQPGEPASQQTLGDAGRRSPDYKDTGEFDKRPVFQYLGDRPSLWSKAKDAWLYGYWQYDWADESIPVQTIDTQNHTITLRHAHVYPVGAGSNYWAENLLEEIDQAGEYVVDWEARKLYVYPGPGFERSRIELSVLTDPVFSLNAAKNVRFQGLTVEATRGDAFSMRDCENVRVEGCTLTDLGERAADISGGRRCGLLSCDVSYCGEGGVSLEGGDRKTLTPCEHFVENCDIREFSRRSQTYRPAVGMSGCGCRAVHNRMHDAPHSAIIYWGNDHLIELNEVFGTVKLTGDGGVFYTGRDWTARGTVIQHNYIHDNVGLKKWENVIYIDDMACGITVSGNLIADANWGMLIGGGRDNVIEDNVLIRCSLGIQMDARGLGWAGTMKDTLMERLNAVPYKEEPWRSRYPLLVGILAHEPLSPMGNIVRRNVLFRSGKLTDRLEDAFKKTGTFESNLETIEDPGFADLSRKDYRFVPGAAVWKAVPGLKAIPVGKIGLYKDRFRKRLP